MANDGYGSAKDWEESEQTENYRKSEMAWDEWKEKHDSFSYKPHWCSRARTPDVIKNEFNDKFGEKTVIHDQTME